MINYTKGKWKELHGDIYCNEERIARSESLGFSRITEAKANAQLIASAPDLYEELKKADGLICHLCKMSMDGTLDCEACDDRKRRLKALAKADGK